LLRATLLQRQHRFDAALADLDAVLKVAPRHAQARLTRATVLQVQGAFDGARAECLALQPLTQELVSAACLASVESATGGLRTSYAQLRAVLERHTSDQAGIRAWVLTSLAEMALRSAMVREAEEHFRQALLIDPEDSYLLGAYADFLLDQGRPAEVIELLRERQRNDGLLLRYALALKARSSKDRVASVDELRSRYAASRLRGERVHLREEARFTLHLLQEAAGALALARQNWEVQKEPADLRILLEAAKAAGDQAALRSARAWLAGTHLEDAQLTRLAAMATHPQ
jgi:Tfp pilus assembly protein PilF